MNIKLFPIIWFNIVMWISYIFGCITPIGWLIALLSAIIWVYSSHSPQKEETLYGKNGAVLRKGSNPSLREGAIRPPPSPAPPPPPRKRYERVR